jgi:hypothetical protein
MRLRSRIFVVALLVFFVMTGQTVQVAVALNAHGNRILGISVNEVPGVKYLTAFNAAKQMGFESLSLNLPWDEIEATPGVYSSKVLSIADQFYPTQQTRVSLVVTLIDTNHLRMPKDLVGKRFDDPIVIDRFNRLMSWVMTQIPNVTLNCVSIGNEVDVYLGTNNDRWQQYTNFFAKTSAHIRQLRSRTPVGAKTTFKGIVTHPDLIRSLNHFADVAMVTYYPLQDNFVVKSPTIVAQDFAAMVQQLPGRPILILEAGYPSSPILDSSERKQSEFIHEVFEAWDRYPVSIREVEFTWENDIPDAMVRRLGTYFGASDAKFLAYLGSIGLRDENGKPKMAFLTLSEETKKRGWW